MGDGEDLRQGSSTLFLVFLFSILSLFLIPYTLYRLCSAGEDASEDVKPWEEVRILTQHPLIANPSTGNLFSRVLGLRRQSVTLNLSHPV